MLAGLLLVVACVPRPAGHAAGGEEGPMQIEFERTGGVAGMRLAATVDTGALEAAEASNVQRLIEQCGFFALPAHLGTPTSGADRFQYRITVRATDRSHTVDIAEGATPPPLRPLIEWLTAAARKPH